jgi:hypothetical protein
MILRLLCIWLVFYSLLSWLMHGTMNLKWLPVFQHNLQDVTTHKQQELENVHKQCLYSLDSNYRQGSHLKCTYKVVTVFNSAQFYELAAPRILNHGTRGREMLRFKFGRIDSVTHLTVSRMELRVDLVVLKKSITSDLQKFNSNSPTNRPVV